MPYEGEFAGYKPLQRIAETDRVKNLLKKSRPFVPDSAGVPALVPKTPPRIQHHCRFLPLQSTGAGPKLTFETDIQGQKSVIARSQASFSICSK